MTPPHDPAAERLPGASRRHAHCPAARLIAAACTPMLAGAVTLFLAREAGVTFLVLFVSSTAVMVLLMVGTGHGPLPETAQHGLAKRRAAKTP